MPSFEIRRYVAPEKHAARAHGSAPPAQTQRPDNAISRSMRAQKRQRRTRSLKDLLPEIERMIRAYFKEHGYPPTMRELSDPLSLSTSQIKAAIAQFVEAGVLEYEPGRSRGMRLAKRRYSTSDPLYDVTARTEEGTATLSADLLPFDLAVALQSEWLGRLSRQHDVILYAEEGAYSPITARRSDGTFIAEYALVEVYPAKKTTVQR